MVHALFFYVVRIRGCVRSIHVSIVLKMEQTHTVQQASKVASLRASDGGDEDQR